MACKRYDVYWVGLDPARGSELRKTRPAVIVSLDVLNRALETVVVCPLTSRLHPGWRTRLPVKVAGKRAEIAADQIRTVSKSRLRKKLGSLSARDAAALRRLLGEMYADS
ncbi:MAG TPA: type II toxin-antitoxin system PemK/MazF family toxin [Candidatus Binatia bacterium]|nr:type II toxin-antitoxin system PemK/MazF family toxin [Candidatus Binatia bacterium]